MYAVLHFAQTVSVAAQHHQHGGSAGAIKAPTRGVLCGVGADKEPEACRAPAAGFQMQQSAGLSGNNMGVAASHFQQAGAHRASASNHLGH